jgi:zinc-finger-containing domain
VSSVREIRCTGCDAKVNARLTDGREIYPNRPDLARKHFWRCDACGNYVGCHGNSREHAPLGAIPTPELRNARGHVHAILDPLWQSGRFRRADLYARLTEQLGWHYHTAQIRSVGEARTVYRLVQEIARDD